MDLSITFSSEQPKYIAIYEQIKRKILQQQLIANEKLPSKRALSIHLNVSIQTVQEAYNQLLSEGYIYSIERSGYYVAPFDEEWKINQPSESERTKVKEAPILYNFKNGQVDEHAFPLKEWLKTYKKVLSSQLVSNGLWQGEEFLREQIVHYVEKAKGFSCDVDQIYLYSGTQHQLQALCQFFGHVEGAIEEPGFKRATAIFRQQQRSMQFVPIDHKGATIPRNSCHFYYVTPAHQFPFGIVMPMERRIELLQWATNENAFLIEDDYDSEFRYKGNPVPPLAQMDQLQRVIYFGTFSKTLLPSIRISYMILPKKLVEPFNLFYRDQKTTVSKVDQLVVAEWMENGMYTKHIAKMRTLYRKKRKKLIECLTAHLGPDYEIIGDDAGLHVVLKLPNWLKEQQAITLAQEVGIAIDAMSANYQTTNIQNYVMIGYGAIPLQNIEGAIELLASQWNKVPL